MWEIKFGDVKVSLSYADVQAIGAAVKSFGFNFTDAVNAPASELLPEVVPDGKSPLISYHKSLNYL
jgi:hypothetical protein